MRAYIAPLILLSLAKAVKGDLHQLIVGTFSTENLYTVEFDDEALTLNLIANTSTDAASSWIALSVSNGILPYLWILVSDSTFSMTRSTCMEPHLQPLQQLSVTL